MTTMTPGARFRAALKEEKPLQVPGAICAYHATLAKASGFRAIYLSGGGVAAGSLGLPDLGISNLDDVLTDVRRITDVCDLPLLVDVDTGFGSSAFNVARTTKSLIKSGAAAMHIEDQVGAKRCGHRPEQGAGDAAGDGRPRAQRRRREDGRRLLHPGAHRRARRRGPAGRDRPRLRLRGGRRRRHLPGGDHRPRHVPQVRRRREGAGPRQHHGVRPDPALHASRSSPRPTSRSRSTRSPPSAP